MLYLVQTWEDWERYRTAIIMLLERVCDVHRIPHLTSVADMVADITKGKETVILDLDENGNCVSLATVEICQYAKMKAFRINACAGKFDDSWYEKMEELEKLGLAHGAQVFEFWARPGFQGFLKKRGYHVSMYNYVKVVKENG